IVAELLRMLRDEIQPGLTTLHLNNLCERYIEKKGAKAAFKGYNGFPNALCISVNEEIVHGIPGHRQLNEGDIVSCDIGVLWKGYYGDAAATFPVGEISREAEKLVTVTQESLYKGIEMAREGNRLYDISHAIQSHVESAGFSVVRMFVGHGIGRELHEDPQIPNYGLPGRGVRLKTGMVLALEPMVNVGHHGVKILNDGWTAVTEDGSLSAHFEHSIAIQNGVPEILSEWEN
ncbi:type I methionyl aminopeptidase, partial [bacterium]|nr:type I methionyl aminopeptidase [candidate division CSSED10-310 bacterium]